MISSCRQPGLEIRQAEGALSLIAEAINLTQHVLRTSASMVRMGNTLELVKVLKTKEVQTERNLGLGVIGPCPTHIQAQQSFLTTHGGPSHCSHQVVIYLTLRPGNIALLTISSCCFIPVHHPANSTHARPSSYSTSDASDLFSSKSKQKKFRHSSKRKFEHRRAQCG